MSLKIIQTFSYYIGNHIDELDRRMKQIQFPKLVRRNVRTFSERHYFKAHEWKIILLFVAYPILKDILPERYTKKKFLSNIYLNLFIFPTLRNLNHLAQLIDAVHILTSNRISMSNLEKAEHLLSSFVENFEFLYGEKNTVFNVHVARHLADCVRSIGPLSTYSNYCFEDHIGHLVSLQKGTTDVASQICDKYLLEKNLFQSLEKSMIAKEFYDEINGKHKFSISHRVEGSIVIGKPKRPQLTEDERLIIFNSLNISYETHIDEYSSVLLNSRVFYENNSCKSKRTDDTFVFNENNGKFGEINSILVIEEKLYLLVNEKYVESFDPTNKCDFIKFLSLTDFTNQTIIESKYVGPKFALIKFNDMIACSRFPNMYERN